MIIIISRKNSLQLTELSSINRVSLVSLLNERLTLGRPPDLQEEFLRTEVPSCRNTGAIKESPY
jgi:hypothetical protein